MRGLAALLMVGGVAAAQDIRVDNGLGTIDGVAVQKVLDEEGAKLNACYLEDARTKRYLGGSVRLVVRVDVKGRVKRAEVAASDLGSWETERCLLEGARKLQFPPPKGGEALVQVPLEFNASSAPGDMPDGAARAAAAKLRGIYRCAGGPKSVPVTLYVGAGGAITSVGFGAVTNEAWGDCAAAKAKAIHVEDPLGRVLKVTVTP